MNKADAVILQHLLIHFEERYYHGRRDTALLRERRIQAGGRAFENEEHSGRDERTRCDDSTRRATSGDLAQLLRFDRLFF